MKLDEKAVSKAQRRLFGIALAVKRGDKSIGDFEDQDAIRQIMKLPDKELKKFAKTKEKDLPQKVAKEDFLSDLRRLAGLKEAKSNNPPIMKFDLSSRLNQLAEEFDEILLGPAVDTAEELHDAKDAKKARTILKEIEKSINSLEKSIKKLDRGF